MDLIFNFFLLWSALFLMWNSNFKYKNKISNRKYKIIRVINNYFYELSTLLKLAATKQIHVNNISMYICLGNRALHAKPHPPLGTRWGGLFFLQLFKKHSKTIFLSLYSFVYFPNINSLSSSLSSHFLSAKHHQKQDLPLLTNSRIHFSTFQEDPKLLFDSFFFVWYVSVYNLSTFFFLCVVCCYCTFCIFGFVSLFL